MCVYVCRLRVCLQGFPVFVILDHRGCYIHTQSAGPLEMEPIFTATEPDPNKLLNFLVSSSSPPIPTGLPSARVHAHVQTHACAPILLAGPCATLAGGSWPRCNLVQSGAIWPALEVICPFSPLSRTPHKLSSSSCSSCSSSSSSSSSSSFSPFSLPALLEKRGRQRRSCRKRRGRGQCLSQEFVPLEFWVRRDACVRHVNPGLTACSVCT